MAEGKSKNWNILELKNYCRKLSREIPEILFHTIEWKLYQINYHGSEAKNLIRKYIEGSFSSEDPDFMEDWQKAYSHVVAFAHAFDTIPDILLQIINYAYLDNPLEKQAVSAKKILNEIKNNNPESEILITAQQFFQNSSINYIRSFINTEKHQHLVDMEYRFEANAQTGKIKEGFRIKSFSDGRQTFAEKWLHEIIENYPEILFNETIKVGISINRDLEKEVNS